jgi:hypothetical protein
MWRACFLSIGGILTDTPPTKTINPAEPEKSEQLCQQAQSEQVCQQAEMDQAGSSGSQVQQSQASPSGQHTVLGRKPLFGR